MGGGRGDGGERGQARKKPKGREAARKGWARKRPKGGEAARTGKREGGGASQGKGGGRGCKILEKISLPTPSASLILS